MQLKVIGLLILAGAIAFLLVLWNGHLLYESAYKYDQKWLLERPWLTTGFKELQTYSSLMTALFSVVAVIGSGLYLSQTRQGKANTAIPIAFIYPLLSLLHPFIGVPLVLFSPFMIGLLLFLVIRDRCKVEMKYLSVATAHNVLFLIAYIGYISKNWDVFS